MTGCGASSFDAEWRTLGRVEVAREAPVDDDDVDSSPLRSHLNSARRGVWDAWKEGTLGVGGSENGGAFEGLRRNPEDGKCYSFTELVRNCRQCFSRAEVERYWLEECVLVMPGEDVRAKPILGARVQKLVADG